MARILRFCRLDVRSHPLIHLNLSRKITTDAPYFLDNDSIEGMAFPPDYRPRGPPPAPHGKPLLNLSDQEQLDGFFAGFDSNNLASNNVSTSGPGLLTGDALVGNEQSLTPQYFISSHTHMQGQPPFVDPNALEGGESMFSGGHVATSMPMAANGMSYSQMIHHNSHALPFGQYPTPHNDGHDYFDPLATSLSQNFPVSWPHTLPSNNIHSSGARPLARFGSDSHFQPSGYVPPLGSTELSDQNALQRFEWLEGDAQSSAPNTQPNTQPSSPVWARKRKADGEPSSRVNQSTSLIEVAQLAKEAGTQPDAAASSSRKRRKVTLKREPDTAFSASKTHASSTPKSSTRGKRKSHSAAFPAQLPLPTKTSPSPTASTARPKRPPAISSCSGSGVRVPLSSDQKRANHTNSEQRRRDQAQRAFARLFDLVPELEHEGKLSQMKKLEKVVTKIRQLEEGNHECRRRIALLESGG